MLKYLNAAVTFSEFPDEITLCINITGCPNHCLGCHSPELWEDIGNNLDRDTLFNLIAKNEGITCVGFMGGDQEPTEVNNLAKFIRKKYPELKIGWYSGKTQLSNEIEIKNFDYIKIGPYIEEKGPINCKTTNQRMLMYNHSSFGKISGEWDIIDITDKFWKDDQENN